MPLNLAGTRGSKLLWPALSPSMKIAINLLEGNAERGVKDGSGKKGLAEGMDF